LLQLLGAKPNSKDSKEAIHVARISYRRTLIGASSWLDDLRAEIKVYGWMHPLYGPASLIWQHQNYKHSL
jgi:hypothetical protein